MSFKDAVALIQFALPGGGETRGTGFLVTERYVLTALHVVAERRASMQRTGQAQPVTFVDAIPLRFGQEQCPARVVDHLWDPREDWALLELDRAVDIEPVALGELHGEAATWRSYGFPDTKPDGMMVEGRVRDASGRIEGVPALQLFSEEAASGGGMPVRGLSGAPCMVEGAAIGILRWVPMANRATGQAHAGTVFACPIPLIAKRCIDLLPPPVAVNAGGSQPQLPAAQAVALPKHRAGRVKQWAKSLLLVAIGLAVSAVAAFVAWPQSSPRRNSDATYVAVRAPRVQSAGELNGVKLIAAGLRQAVLRAITNLEGLVAIADDDVDLADSDSKSLRELARALAADEVIASKLLCTPEACDVVLNWVRSDGGVRQTESFEIRPPTDYRRSLHTVVSYVRRGFADYSERSGLAALEVSSQDYGRYLRLQRAYSHKDPPMTTDEILDGLNAIRERSLGFVEVYLFEANLLTERYKSSRDPADTERASSLAEVAQKLAPESPEPLKVWFRVALASGELDTAEQMLNKLENIEPGNVENLELRARLEAKRGDPQRAIAILRQAASERPSWRILYRLAQYESSNGQLAAAREHLAQFLQIWPDNYYGQSLLAKDELLHGSLERAAELYARLVERSHAYVPYTNLGFAQLLMGRASDAIGNFARAVELKPKNPNALLNLGNAQELAGDRKAATSSYQRALTLLDENSGARDSKWAARRAAILAHLQRSSEAPEQSRPALQNAPNNRDVRYLAAQVYAVTEQDKLAVHNVKEALELGYDAIWFGFPWFDRIRRDPEINALLATPRRRGKE